MSYYTDMHTRLLGSALLALTLTVGFALPVSANTTQISTDPAYAAQPFSFYCEPFVTSFKDANHYLPTGPCTFSVPGAVGGSIHGIFVYKGIPGNSTVVGGDQYAFSAPTLIREDSMSFGTPAQDQDYFGVIFGANSQGDITQFNEAFTVGSSTNTLLPSDNYRLIRWKWGAKPASEFEPVVLIPDIFNSWVTDTGVVIDPIFKTYQNIQDTFLANGYVNNQNFFIFPYNWEDSMATNAQAFAAKIAAIKATCGCTNIDVIAHGTGGYIAAQYIESAGYQNDIDQLFFLGTPFYGIPSGYKALEGGQISFGSATSDGLAQVLINQEAKDAGYTNAFAYINQKPVSAFKEIVPVFNDYLFDAGFNPQPFPQNAFLQTLLANFTQVVHKVMTRTVLADDGQFNTPVYFSVAPSTQLPLWADGQPTQTFNDSGDSMVPRSSIESLIGSADYEVAGSHRALPTAAQSLAFNTFNGKNPTTVVANTYPVSCVLFVTTSQGADLQITDPNSKRLGKDFATNTTFSEIPDSLYSGFNATTEYGAVANPVAGQYQVQMQGTVSGTFTLNATDVCGSNIFSTSTTATLTPGQIAGYGLNISSTTQEITLTPLDTHPPLVTIVVPQQGQTYPSTSTTTLVSLTVVDPENSPIATTTYRLNGNLINGLVPLPLGTTPVGSATLAVAVTDVFGNTGYATSTFTISAPPPPAGTDCIMALNPTKEALKLEGSATLTAQNCKVQVNSNASGALNITGSAKITSAGNCIVGTVLKNGSSSITPAPTVPCSPKADPYASHAKPSVGDCTFTNTTVNGSQTKTLNPGVYCNGINVGGSAKVTLNPGLYILKNGPLTVNGSGKVGGTGVTFFLTGGETAVNLSGSAQLTLTPMTTGVLSGFAFFLDPYSPTNAKSEFNGSSVFNVAGVVYLPKQRLNIGGSANTGSPVQKTTFIADTFYLNGSAQLKTSGTAVVQ